MFGSQLVVRPRADRFFDHCVNMCHNLIVRDELRGPGSNIVKRFPNLGDLPLLIFEVRRNRTFDNPTSRPF
jgi:hypothetical protein